MAELGVVLLALVAILPFAIALRIRTVGPLEEPPYRLEGPAIIVSPTCDHCGWAGELDVTDHVNEAAAMAASTIMKSPPCRSCGRRWKINLTGLAQRRRAGNL